MGVPRSIFDMGRSLIDDKLKSRSLASPKWTDTELEALKRAGASIAQAGATMAAMTPSAEEFAKRMAEVSRLIMANDKLNERLEKALGESRNLEMLRLIEDGVAKQTPFVLSTLGSDFRVQVFYDGPAALTTYLLSFIPRDQELPVKLTASVADEVMESDGWMRDRAKLVVANRFVQQILETVKAPKTKLGEGLFASIFKGPLGDVAEEAITEAVDAVRVQELMDTLEAAKNDIRSKREAKERKPPPPPPVDLVPTFDKPRAVVARRRKR